MLCSQKTPPQNIETLEAADDCNLAHMADMEDLPGGEVPAPAVVAVPVDANFCRGNDKGPGGRIPDADDSAWGI